MMKKILYNFLALVFYVFAFKNKTQAVEQWTKMYWVKCEIFHIYLLDSLFHWVKTTMFWSFTILFKKISVLPRADPFKHKEYKQDGVKGNIQIFLSHGSCPGNNPTNEMINEICNSEILICFTGLVLQN